MKTLILISMLLCRSLVFAQTNGFYITDESLLGREKPGHFSAEQIEAAKHAKDSRPAQDDPEGNWGAVSEGFQLSLRLEKNSFTNGEPIKVLVILRNVSDKSLEFLISTYGDPQIAFTLMKGQDVLKRLDDATGTNFLDSVRKIRTESLITSECLPGTQRKFTFDLNPIYDLSAPGNYEIQANKTIAKLKERARAELISGKAEFQIKVQP
jgi:hypothetical protein